MLKEKIRSWLGSRTKIQLDVDFKNGPKVEVIESDQPLNAEFLVDQNIIHSDRIEQGNWTKAHRRYVTPWVINVRNLRGDIVFRHTLDMKNKNVRIFVDSKSLGDTLAWIPQVERFAEQHSDARIYVSHHWPSLIDEAAYPNLNFIEPKSSLEPCYASFSIGYYFDELDHCHPRDPRTRSLSDVASDILGLTSEERRPIVLKTPSSHNDFPSRYVTLASSSTAACKHWLHPTGWQQLIEWLRTEGFEVMVIQRESTDLINIIDQTGDFPIAERATQIKNSFAFIGLASGLSWLAWALDKPVLMIAGFSLPETEFQSNCERVINRDVCHGCWNNTEYTFERGDWNWCPEHYDTSRQHECSIQISPELVIAHMRRLLVRLSVEN